MKGARRYIKVMAKDQMIHKCVASAVNGLREFLQVERKRIPGNILFEADRLECGFLSGYKIQVSKAMNHPVFEKMCCAVDCSTLRDYSRVIGTLTSPRCRL